MCRPQERTMRLPREFSAFQQAEVSTHKGPVLNRVLLGVSHSMLHSQDIHAVDLPMSRHRGT